MSTNTSSSAAPATPAILGGPKSVHQPWPQWPQWNDDDRHALLNVLDSGKWWQYAYGTAEYGDHGTQARSQVEQFEQEFAALHRVKHGIAVTSGQMALDICMRAIDLQPGDEVITTPYTFFATSMCILNAHAWPVYVDIDPQTYNLDVKQIEQAITPRTRAILPVHFSGELCDMDAMLAIARKHNLRVIEDAAHAHGVALRDGRYAGSFGDAAIFSLQQSKPLTAGEGGIILTHRDDLAEKAWSLRHYGREKQGLWYEHFHLAWNGRMTELAAGLLRTQLKKLPQQNATRMANHQLLAQGLARIGGLTLTRLHPLSHLRSHCIVMMRYDAAQWDGLSRQTFVKALNAEGVPAMTGYTFASFENPIFARLDMTSPSSLWMRGRSQPVDYTRCPAQCPHTLRACREEAVWLPHHLLLGDGSHVQMVLAALGKVRAHLPALRQLG